MDVGVVMRLESCGGERLTSGMESGMEWNEAVVITDVSE